MPSVNQVTVTLAYCGTCHVLPHWSSGVVRNDPGCSCCLKPGVARGAAAMPCTCARVSQKR